MKKRTAYVANVMDEGTWGAFQDDPPDSWYEAVYPVLHPTVLMADQPTEEWLNDIKEYAVEEYFSGFEADDARPTLEWSTKDPDVDDVRKTWSQEHVAKAREEGEFCPAGELLIVLIVRRVEVAIA